MRIIKLSFLASLLTVAATVFPLNDAHAQYGYCSEPSEPSCLDMLGISRDEFSFQLCPSEVESYVDDVKRYIDCLVMEVKSTRAKQNRKVDDVIERFNCYASGNDFCY